MKKIIFSALAVLVGAFVFVSCSKEAKFEKNIVGTWEQTRYWDDDEEEWYDESDWGATYTYEFKSEGKGTFTVKYSVKNGGERYSNSFNYTITDDKITFKWKEGDMYDEGDRESYTIESLKGKKMVWEYKGDKVELTKK